MNFETLIVRTLLDILDHLIHGNQTQRLERTRADLVDAMEVHGQMRVAESQTRMRNGDSVVYKMPDDEQIAHAAHVVHERIATNRKPNDGIREACR